MSKIESIERHVEELDDTAFAVCREWFLAYENERWDRHNEQDSRSGSFDALVQDAGTAHLAGKPTPLGSTLLLQNFGQGITPCPPLFKQRRERWQRSIANSHG